MKNRLIGVFFVLMFMSTWAWMLGVFAIPDNVEAPAHLKSWMNPGILTFPAIISAGFFVAANYFFTLKSIEKGGGE